MATTTLPQLLDSLRQSVASVSEATPKLEALPPPADGLSLLDVKNELLLSYLEHMVFLILLKLRNASAQSDDGVESLSLEGSELGQAAVKKLVELRLYLEKGVRPLEEKLRYQIEKALRAAEDAERAAKRKEEAAAAAAQSSDEDDDDDDDGSDAVSVSDDEADDKEGAEAVFEDDEEAAASRPNRAAFVRPATSTAAAAVASKARAKAKGGDAATAGADADGAAAAAGGGVYRPPKIAPTMMPTTTTERRERAARRPLKSATMDEFIADELSTTPMAELSIGANIAGHGRHLTTASERQRDEERREYEERNFVRLPKEGKKARAQRNKAEGRSSQMRFGGEDWRGLGEGVDRINRLTQRKSSSAAASGGASGGGGASAARSLLDRSRKRGIDTVDGPRGSGASAGQADSIGGRFEKRLRLHQLGRRDRGKKK